MSRLKVNDLVVVEYQKHYDPWSGETTDRYMRSYGAYPPAGLPGILTRLKPYEMCEALFDQKVYTLHINDLKTVEKEAVSEKE